jgi:hypothetical protein
MEGKGERGKVGREINPGGETGSLTPRPTTVGPYWR